jgi:methyl-accepting chemotaxis protein
MFANFGLKTKFNLLLSVVFLAGILIGGVTLWRILNQRAQAEITSQGLILIETMNAVRRYTSGHIQPLLSDRLATEDQFLAETVPAYSAGTVFADFQRREEHASFRYKEAAPNPTNPAHLADPFEMELVAMMQRDASLTEISDFRMMDGRRVYYIARPLSVTAESCLYCHSVPENAPDSLIAAYGAEGGFGWELGEVVAAQMIYVPAEEVFNATLRSFGTVMTIFILILGLVIALINFLLSRYVLEPINALDNLAQRVKADKMEVADLDAPALMLVTSRGDELGRLSQVFKQMANEVYQRTQSLKQQVTELRVEVDQFKRQQEVKAITDNEFFKELQAKAREMRQKRSPDD